MRKAGRIEDALMVLLFAIFAMPFFGGYLMLDKEAENKVLGGILCVVGIIIWIWFGLR